ncbi:MAG: hypothetical protein IJX40_01330 [Alistipes sp.]|nr:hypothetical protein [Alistipes sp.]
MNYPSRAHDMSAELLTTPTAIFGRLVRDLHHARHSIDMEYYIYASDRTGCAISDILCRKARQGVKVRLLIDGYGSRRMSRALLRRLRTAGVVVERHGLLRYDRNHRKMTIIDRHTAHVGGVNIADRYAVGDSLGAWHDVQLRLEGDGVVSLVALFEYDYVTAMGIRAVPPPMPSCGDVRIHCSEAQHGGAMYALLEDVVASAQHSVTITSPYFMPPHRVVEALAAAVCRGVRTTVIVPARCDIWVLDNVVRCHIARCQARGVEMLILREGFLHAKMALVDGRVTMLGSANLDARSLTINRELMLSTTRRSICHAAETYLLALREKCSLPARDDLRSAIPAIVARLLEPVL